ncbi:unnamed protein product [Porites evermanni]|uniref:Uncharacterized protein n=1 Tax=Porites evermanni TaxID=104178 RepID=A0ABN8LS30_9CNID|nr:unnamed protein product [Porites evermanni]CAH3029047.1 unnamed protein product [Porites evermanni]
MRFEVLLQSAALKNLRQKLSQVSFSAGFSSHFTLAHLFVSSAFYLSLLLALAVCAFLVRIIGATPQPQPISREKPKPVKSSPSQKTSLRTIIDRDVFQKQLKNKSDIPSEFLDKEKPNLSLTKSTVEQPLCGTATPRLHVDIPSTETQKQRNSMISPLTMFLLEDSHKHHKSIRETTWRKRENENKEEEHNCKTRKLD